MIKFLIGGSPCTHWSIAQKNNRETTAEGIGWELFKNYLIAKEQFGPDYFLYENNKSAAPAIKNQIAAELHAPLQYINSALVSAQNRQRFYCHNFGDVPPPADRGIILRDILESGAGFGESRGKSYALTATYYKGNEPEKVLAYHERTHVAEPVSVWGDGTGQKSRPVDAHYAKGVKPIYRVQDGKIAIKGQLYPINLPDGFYIIRKLTVTECCRLQTMPDDYCRAVSATQAYKGLGNGWTAEVIIHLLSHALRGIPKDEPITVLSMYDGIGTGRYCFDKLGYRNITYYAYEIDKYAMQIAASNYPDIIQKGDAFQVRNADWFLRDNSPKLPAPRLQPVPRQRVILPQADAGGQMRWAI